MTLNRPTGLTFAGIPVHLNDALGPNEVRVIEVPRMGRTDEARARAADRMLVVGSVDRFRFNVERAGARLDARSIVRNGLLMAFPDLVLPPPR